jgi:hypothetical protein
LSCLQYSQSASELINLVGDFFGRITDKDSSISSSLGLGNSSESGFAIDLDLESLVNDTFLSANFDTSFRLEVSLKVTILILRSLVTYHFSPLIVFCYDKNPLEKNIDSMVSLGIKTWGARAALLVDPMSLALRYGNYSIGVRDSSMAVDIYLRSQGEYSTTISGLSEASKSPLIPTISVPVLAEVMFDVNVSNVSLSPILTVSSMNAIDGITVDYDAALDTFIDSFGLDVIFANVTTLLTEIAHYGPNLTVGDAPCAVFGMLDVVNDAKEFSSALQEFISIADDGEICHMLVFFKESCVSQLPTLL